MSDATVAAEDAVLGVARNTHIESTKRWLIILSRLIAKIGETTHSARKTLPLYPLLAAERSAVCWFGHTLYCEE